MSRLTRVRRVAVRALLAGASLLAVTLLLAAVTSGAAAPRIDLGQSSGGFALLLDLLTLFMVVGSLMGLVFMLASMRLNAGTRRDMGSARRSGGALLAVIAILVLFRLLPEPTPRQGDGPTVDLGAGNMQAPPLDIPADPGLIVGAVATAILLALAAALLRRSERRRLTGTEPAASSPRQPVDEPLAAASLAARRDLEAIADPRAAILAAYETLRARLAQVGIAPAVDDTPRQLLRRALEDAGAPPEPTRDLVALFEEARFSTHTLTPRHRTTAIELLGTIAAGLAASSR